jgi:hypothetical protein
MKRQKSREKSMCTIYVLVINVKSKLIKFLLFILCIKVNIKYKIFNFKDEVRKMYILLFILMLIFVYIKSFKENFNSESIQKVVPPLLMVGAVIIILTILSAIS